MPDCWQPEGHEDWRETEGLGTPHQTRWRHTVFAVKEPATPWHAKAFGADVDDVLLLTALMWLAVKRLPARLLADGRIQADAWLQVQGRKTQRRMVSAAIGTVFVQESADAARDAVAIGGRSAPRQVPQARHPHGRGRERRARLHDLPAGALDPDLQHNPLERLNAEIKRRTNVVGIFPNDASITRLVGAMMLEQNDEWSLNRRYARRGRGSGTRNPRTSALIA